MDKYLCSLRDEHGICCNPHAKPQFPTCNFNRPIKRSDGDYTMKLCPGWTYSRSAQPNELQPELD
jgi:hypothetical protein